MIEKLIQLVFNVQAGGLGEDPERLFSKMKNFLEKLGNSGLKDIIIKIVDGIPSIVIDLLFLALVFGITIFVFHWSLRKLVKFVFLQISSINRKVSESEFSAAKVEIQTKKLIFDLKKAKKLEKGLNTHFNNIDKLSKILAQLNLELENLKTEYKVAQEKDISAYDNKRQKKHEKLISALKKQIYNLEEFKIQIGSEVVVAQQGFIKNIRLLFKKYEKPLVKENTNLNTAKSNLKSKSTNPQEKKVEFIKHQTPKIVKNIEQKPLEKEHVRKKSNVRVEPIRQVRKKSPSSLSNSDIDNAIFSNSQAKKDIEPFTKGTGNRNGINKLAARDEHNELKTTPSAPAQKNTKQVQTEKIPTSKTNPDIPSKTPMASEPTFKESTKYALYSDIPGGFSVATVSDSNTNNEIYKIALKQDIIEFEISDNKESQSMALSNSQFYLKNACDYSEIPFENARIITEKKGVLKKLGNEYKIIEKAKLKFME